ncbi:MAG: DUF4300 family protein [Acutalibacteraceae bacterium]
MKKKLTLMLAVLMLVVSTVACGQNGKKEIPVGTVSHLAGEQSQKILNEYMKSAGISEERRKVFFDHVRQFNEAVDSSVLYDSFTQADPLTQTYDVYDYQDQWAEKYYPEFNGYNCRITAMGLLGDKISTDINAETRDNELFLDKESLEADNSVFVGENDETKFCQIFSMIPTDNTKDVSVHAENIRKDWEERGISFETGDKLSLITVWFHDKWSDEENELTVGHTGVLINCQDRVLFVEKIAFQEPYQVSCFGSKGDLVKYLTDKYNVSWDQETASPFIMENDVLISSAQG